MSEWEALTALAEESRTLSAVLLDLDAEQFQRPTNCPPWDLKELVVHTAASIALPGDYRRPEPGAPLRSLGHSNGRTPKSGALVSLPTGRVR